MKKISLLALFFAVSLSAFIVSCEGPEGPQGPAGAAGAKGDTGAKGDKGDQGTANVKYTDWFLPAAWGEISRAPDNVFFLDADTRQAILTEEAINKSAVYVYTRYNELVQEGQEYKLQQRITIFNSVTGWTKLPGRNTSVQKDFHKVMTSTQGIGVNYFSPTIYLDFPAVLNTTSGKYEFITEYQKKTDAELIALAKDMVSFRIVVIPGAVLSARQKTVDFSNYEEVKEEFGLTD